MLIVQRILHVAVIETKNQCENAEMSQLHIETTSTNIM